MTHEGCFALVCMYLSQVTEIQRVWSLHNVLLTLDSTSEDNKEMIDLLLRCFNRPVFLKNDDVRRDSVALSLCWALLSCWLDDAHVVAGKAVPGLSFQLERQLHLAYPRHRQKPAGVLQQVGPQLHARRHPSGFFLLFTNQRLFSGP